jgi:hypothetical protein
MDRMVEVVDGGGGDLCSILEGDTGIWRLMLALSMYFGYASSSVGGINIPRWRQLPLSTLRSLYWIICLDLFHWNFGWRVGRLRFEVL